MSPSASEAALRPRDAGELAEALRERAEAGRAVRVVGGATRQGWGNPLGDDLAELSTLELGGVVEHNEGDLTAVLGAGTTLAAAQERFAAAGQMLALDPPDDPRATIGGLIATGDSGPLRHRHGAVSDLIVGITVARPDGRLARAGGKVIKNVAGYDLPKLHCGAVGTLGVVVDATFRLHPVPAHSETVVAEAVDPEALGRIASALAAAPLELQCLDVRWHDAAGAVLARAAGAAAPDVATAAARIAAGESVSITTRADDDALWAAQARGQRARDGEAVLRVSARPSRLADVLRTAEAVGAEAVGRAGLGLSWIRLPAASAEALIDEIAGLRERLRPATATVLDAPEEVRCALDPWDLGDGPELALMRRIKARFDPGGVCNPGLFVSGI